MSPADVGRWREQDESESPKPRWCQTLSSVQLPLGALIAYRGRMGSSEASRLGEACQRLHARVHAEDGAGLTEAEKAELSYLLGITAGQALRIEELQTRVADLERALVWKEGE